MIQLVVNTNMLREIDERKLINAYARLNCDSEDVTDDIIKENLKKVLDWDINGDNGLGIYCGKFEKIKNKDWPILIQFIRDNQYEISKISKKHLKNQILENNKVVFDEFERKKARNIERCSNPDYEVSGRGKKAKPCYYEGRYYKSRQECEIKEGIGRSALYNYLKRTGQL